MITTAMIANDDITYKDIKIMSGVQFMAETKDVEMLLSKKAARFASIFTPKPVEPVKVAKKTILKATEKDKMFDEEEDLEI